MSMILNDIIPTPIPANTAVGNGVKRPKDKTIRPILTPIIPLIKSNLLLCISIDGLERFLRTGRSVVVAPASNDLVQLPYLVFLF